MSDTATGRLFDERHVDSLRTALAVLGLETTHMDPLVDASGGIASFLMSAEGSQLIFI